MITITYHPPTGPDLVLKLPSPKLGQSVSLSLRTKIKRAMSGTVWTYKKSPLVYRFQWEFSHIQIDDFVCTDLSTQPYSRNTIKIEAIKSFLLATNNKTISLVDSDASFAGTWVGKIYDSMNTFTESTRFGTDWTLKFFGTQTA